jgi:hypothetical protein
MCLLDYVLAGYGGRILDLLSALTLSCSNILSRLTHSSATLKISHTHRYSVTIVQRVEVITVYTGRLGMG